MNRFKKNFVILLLLFITFLSEAQITIKGNVTDSKTNEALIYASVYLSISNKGCATNTNGNFIIYANKYPDTLIVSYVGYKTKKILITKNIDLKIKLESNTIILDNAIVVDMPSKSLARLIIDAVKVQKYKTEPMGIKSKAYGKIYTTLNDTIPVEFFEAYYTCEHNNLQLKILQLFSG